MWYNVRVLRHLQELCIAIVSKWQKGKLLLYMRSSHLSLRWRVGYGMVRDDGNEGYDGVGDANIMLLLFLMVTRCSASRTPHIGTQTPLVIVN